jgi:hypothetical protein
MYTSAFIVLIILIIPPPGSIPEGKPRIGEIDGICSGAAKFVENHNAVEVPLPAFLTVSDLTSTMPFIATSPSRFA